MITQGEINRIVYTAASAVLQGIGLSEVYSEPITNSDGQDALHVTIVIKDAEEREVTGDQALDAMVRINKDLQACGEERFPVIDFVREHELDMNGDT